MKKSMLVLAFTASATLLAVPATKVFAQYLPVGDIPVQTVCGASFIDTNGRAETTWVDRASFSRLGDTRLWIGLHHEPYYGKEPVIAKVTLLQKLKRQKNETILGFWAPTIEPGWSALESVATQFGPVTIRCGEALKEYERSVEAAEKAAKKAKKAAKRAAAIEAAHEAAQTR